MRLLEESETEMHPRYERLCQEMIALTCYPGPHTADSLARRMYRNKQQIQSDLRWWQGILKVLGLTLSDATSASSSPATRNGSSACTSALW